LIKRSKQKSRKTRSHVGGEQAAAHRTETILTISLRHSGAGEPTELMNLSSIYFLQTSLQTCL
jgi:hypothetical protein